MKRALLTVLTIAVTAGLSPSLFAQDAPPNLPEPPKEKLWDWDENDPRIGLKPGLYDAGEAAMGVTLLATMPKPEGFQDAQLTGGSVSNTDLAFQGDYAFVGNYRGFNIYDVSSPNEPSLLTSVVCPGGQGDVSVYKNLLFMSVQETRGRLDCGTQGVQDVVSDERFRGVRIFDIQDIRTPRQVAAVQTCRGSHTHTVVSDPNDDANVYVYVQGTSRVRPTEELPGCSSATDPDEDPNTSYFRIEVIKVPMANPAAAEIVNMPRIFESEGNIGGLWQGGDHGPGTQSSRRTNQCHDITAYPAVGLAAGACSGNGILLDITDPANPVRVEQVVDPNFAYWHSATFNNDGTTIIFTDEWGGGGAPRCTENDPQTWGANAIFDLEDGKLKLRGYYKLPVPQTTLENCVAHNGSIIPVPGRDIKAQAWYQGGMSIFDFTDPENAFEIGFFDRGPVNDSTMISGGYWSTYWHNGYLFGAEIARGFDIFQLEPSEHLTVNEIEAAKLVSMRDFNAQEQPRVEWPAHPVVAKAYIDQLVRAGDSDAQGLYAAVDTGDEAMRAEIAAELERRSLASLAAGRSSHVDNIRVRLAEVLRQLETEE
ncbi:MAG: hypothetical protein JJ896_06645 [Rhodothermales bacterium]|nr:hypothetical protein [Rhodothermales bacterium]MBO6779314.1 hypothetical protein [Rhodothermales bacterium]